MHGEPIGTVEVSFRLLDEVIINVERYVLIESSVIISVAAFNFTIVPRCSWSNEFVLNAQLLAQDVKRMADFGLPEMGKLKAIVSMNDFGHVSNVLDGHLDKLDC